MPIEVRLESSGGVQCPHCGDLVPASSQYCLTCHACLSRPRRRRPDRHTRQLREQLGVNTQVSDRTIWNQYWDSVLSGTLRESQDWDRRSVANAPSYTWSPARSQTPSPLAVATSGGVASNTPTFSIDPSIDEPSVLLNTLSFFCPLIGLVAYLSLITRLPRQAISAGRTAVWGLGVLASLFTVMAVGPHLRQSLNITPRGDQRAAATNAVAPVNSVAVAPVPRAPSSAPPGATPSSGGSAQVDYAVAKAAKRPHRTRYRVRHVRHWHHVRHARCICCGPHCGRCRPDCSIWRCRC